MRSPLVTKPAPRSRLPLAAGLLAAGLLPSALPAQVGPDAFGYSGITSTDPGGPAYSFVDIVATGTLVATGDDLSSINSGILGPVTLGKPFPFYGVLHTQLVAATNGYLSTSLTDGGPDLSNDCPLPATPSTGGGARIYPLHDDLVGDVYYQYFAVCPRPHESGEVLGASVFLWDVFHFGGAGNFLFEAILYDNGDIVFQHAAGNPELGSGSTTGIQNLGATIGLTLVCNTAASVPANFAVRITPRPQDALLHGAKGKFTIDWAQHAGGVDADAFAMTGTLNRSGIAADLTGATFLVSVNGTDLFPAQALDAGGSAASAAGTTRSFKMKVSAKKGTFAVQARGLDLRTVLGLANADEEGTTPVAVRVEVAGAGLVTPAAYGLFEFSYATKVDSRSSGSFAFKTGSTLTGLVRPGRVAVVEDSGEHEISMKKGLLAGNAGGPVLVVDDPALAGDVTMTIKGAAPIAIPFNALAISGAGGTSVYTYDAGLVSVPGLERFSISNVAHTFSFATSALAGTGIPLAAPGALNQHAVPITIDVATATGTLRIQTTVTIRRTSDTSENWAY